MTENWKKIEGFDFAYGISDKGRFFIPEHRDRKNHFYKDKFTYGTSKPYKQVTMYKDGKLIKTTVHILVAKAFPEICGEWFEGAVVDHINTIADDNRAENLRVCTTKDNLNNPLTKQHMKICSLGKNSKTILQYSVNGDFIKEWDSIKDAASFYNHSQSSIYGNLVGKQKTSCGFIWRYKT